MDYSKKKLEDLIVMIYSGEVSPRNLPVDLCYAIYDYLDDALMVGLSKYDVLDAFYKELSTNVFLFSGAKTFQFVYSTRGLIYDGKKIIPLNDFKKLAKQNYQLYNDTWLEAEYNTTLGQAQNAGHWHTMTKNRSAGEYLRYNAILDANTSEICRRFDGIVRHMDDKFWDTAMPLNHYNCRCTIDQIDLDIEGVSETSSKKAERAVSENSEVMNKVFMSNSGKTKKVFNSSHPYFDVPAEYKPLARSNFNIPIPKKLMSDE